MVNFIKKQNIYGPVEKLQFLSDAAAISELSRAELAVLNVLADMANATTGLAWPSFQTLGKRIGTTDRSAKRAVSGLAKAGLLEIVEPGTRNHKSNRYKLGKIQTSDTDDTTLVTRVTGASDTCDQKLVTRTSPKSINQSEQEARIEKIDRDAAAPLRPGGLGAGRQTVESDCSEFWQALGRQQTVYQSEQLIAELVASGIDYADIVAGAKRYAEYCTRTGAAQKMTPASWLSNRKWLDDWNLETSYQPKKHDKKANNSNQTKTATNSNKRRGPPKYNPANLEWNAKQLEYIRTLMKKYGNGCLLNKSHENYETALNLVREWNRQNPEPPEFLDEVK